MTVKGADECLLNGVAGQARKRDFVFVMNNGRLKTVRLWDG